MDEISILLAFAYGLLSFLSPCILPLVPVYLGSLAGPEIFNTQAKGRQWPVFLHSLTFVIGFSVMFTLWGAGAGLVGSALFQYTDVLRQVSGSLLIAFGLLMLAALKVPWLNYEKRLNLSLGRTTGYLRSFLIGAVFPVAWIPCASWVLGAILMLASTSETAGQGAYLLSIYSLGLGLPFLAIGAAFDFLTPWLKKISRYSTWIYVVSSILLIAVGILILADKLVWFSAGF